MKTVKPLALSGLWTGFAGGTCPASLPADQVQWGDVIVLTVVTVCPAAQPRSTPQLWRPATIGHRRKKPTGRTVWIIQSAPTSVHRVCIPYDNRVLRKGGVKISTLVGEQ
ncbi:hypothetical protein PYCCODRAFT_472247 [Trametes coccinea BRFM310]|uniref:Uncharacterized protein n=1 Tax=Trametes coccinea (strain BRFM310) TaxID=1353009 RepID=A0A1Y2IKX9_TRAC3|nr:hypothetical protein PYCCODRAFT_472247 [Trametes coccinea BRFM310]